MTMKVPLCDRVTGARIQANTLPEPIVAGRWQVITDTTANLNSIPAKVGDFLIPDADGTCELATGEEIVQRHFFSEGWAAEVETNGVREINEQLQQLNIKNDGWNGWLSVTPLIDIGQIIELNAFDKKLQENLYHLEEVCARPHIYLKMDEERLPISRVRRMASDAIDYLAAHPEDWDYLQVQYVLPKRIRGLVPDDELDIYENRLAARLVDKLAPYLQKRLDSVRRLYDDLERYQKQSIENLEHSAYRRAARVSTLLSKKSISVADGVGKAGSTLKILEALLHRILGLFDSALYRAVPRNASVESTLHHTNIMTNDAHYRQVGVLWTEARKAGLGQRKSAQELFEERQMACRAFNLFCRLLVCHALDQLGFSPVDQGAAFTTEKQDVWFIGPTGKVKCSWHPDGALVFVRPGSETQALRIVPVLEPMTRHVDYAAKRLASFDVGDQPLVMLYPSSIKERQSFSQMDVLQRLFTLGNDLHEPMRLGFIPVSSWEADSVERVARVLRWALWVPFILDYPAKIDVPSTIKRGLLETAPDWLKQDPISKRVRVIKPPTSGEERHFSEWLADLQQHARARGRWTSHQQATLPELEKLKKRIEAAQNDLKTLLVCPVCHQPTDVHRFEPRESGGFRAICNTDSCGAEWGIALCGECQRSFPFLISRRALTKNIRRTVGWIDDVLGADVLAMPCWGSEPGSVDFICPNCGQCRNRQHADDLQCLRCRTARGFVAGSSIEVEN